MLLFTGDIHGDSDIYRLKRLNRSGLSRSDYLVICGDFGLIWDGSKEEKWWLDWLDKKPFTTLWIDGNHENFDMLKEYPVEEWNGGKIQRITENIFHLCRGGVFTIDGMKIFAFGGAESHDKKYRKYGKNIWEEEMPSEKERAEGLAALDKAGREVDIVITHSLPESLQKKHFPDLFPTNELTLFFDTVKERLTYKNWFSGHYHCDMEIDEKHRVLFYDIVAKDPVTGVVDIFSTAASE